MRTQVTGKKSTIQEYVFEGVEGIPYFNALMVGENGETYSSSYSGEGLSDSSFNLHVGDDEDKTILDAVVYLAPNMHTMDGMTETGVTHEMSEMNETANMYGDLDVTTTYINPVYQSDDGKVYVVGGQGMSMGGDQTEGSAFSQKLEETITVTENGKAKTMTTVINISFKIMLPPEKVVILEMDEASSIVNKKEYKSGKLPESVTPTTNTDYFIVESYKTDFDGNEKVSRAVFSKEDQALESFRMIKNGIIVKQQTPVNW